MPIDTIGELAKELNCPGPRLRNGPISPSLTKRLGAIARTISECAKDYGELVGLALFTCTLEEHARGTDSLGSFVVSSRRCSPNRTGALATLLAAIGDGRSKPRIANALTQASSAEANADHLVDLVNLTLAYARRTCRRYASEAYPTHLGSLQEFAAAPTLTRGEVEKDLAGICAKDAPIDFYTATSATSTGRTLLVPHCRAELATLADSLSAPTSEQGMTLRLMPAGRLMGGTMGGGETVLATYDTNAARENGSDMWDHIAGQLFAEFPTPRGGQTIKTIHATPPFGLILLTKYMLQRGLDPKESAVRSLLVTGAWIGQTTWRWLEEAWGATLHTTYSCSELVGAAVACPTHPGRYHFAANLLPEVLSQEGKRVNHGEQGRLHLSGLYPFQRSAIFLRYEVGDWGRWYAAESCDCGLHSASFEMLGRTPDVLTLTSSDGTRWPVPPIPIRNALDRFDCVPKIPRPQYKLRIENTARGCNLWVEVECYALAGQSWQRRTRDAITAAILEEDESLRALVATGETGVQVALFARSKLTTSVRVR